MKTPAEAIEARRAPTLIFATPRPLVSAWWPRYTRANTKGATQIDRACFADLDEHIWEVAHNPFVWIGPSDN